MNKKGGVSSSWLTKYEHWRYLHWWG